MADLAMVEGAAPETISIASFCLGRPEGASPWGRRCASSRGLDRRPISRLQHDQAPSISSSSADAASGVGRAIVRLGRCMPNSDLPEQPILIAGDCPAAASAARVLSVLLGRPLKVVDHNAAEEIGRVAPQALLIVGSFPNRDDVPLVLRLRRTGFAGPVLVVTTGTYGALLEKHRVLAFGEGSHGSWSPSNGLGSLVEQATGLLPLEPENLQMLQREIEMRVRRPAQRVHQILAQLKPGVPAPSTAAHGLRDLIGELRCSSSRPCHNVVTVGDQTSTLHAHFERLMGSLSESSVVVPSIIAEIEQAVNRWEKLAIDDPFQGPTVA